LRGLATNIIRSSGARQLEGWFAVTSAFLARRPGRCPQLADPWSGVSSCRNLWSDLR